VRAAETPSVSAMSYGVAKRPRSLIGCRIVPEIIRRAFSRSHHEKGAPVSCAPFAREVGGNAADSSTKEGPSWVSGRTPTLAARLWQNRFGQLLSSGPPTENGLCPPTG
jgi:hypothetical protein